MKKILKDALLMSLILAMVCILYPVQPSAASTRKCYTISSGNTTVYSNTGLTRKYGTIYGSDEVTVLSVTSRYSKVSYPVSGGRTKTGYIRTSDILLGTGGNSYQSRAKIDTYRRPGGSSYGYIASGDQVVVLGKTGNYTQVKYPVSSGYKYAFITTDNANKYVYNSSNNNNNNNNYASVPDGLYIFYSAVGSNKVLDVQSGDSADGANIQLWTDNGTDAQKFYITKQSDNYYKIANINSGKALDICNSENREGTNVIQWTWRGGANQKWKFVSLGNGYYQIRSSSGYYLDVNGGSSADGTNVQIWSGNSSNAQKWKLVKTSRESKDETYYVTTKAGLRLRKSPSTSGSKITTMPYGAAVSVHSTSNGWAYLTYNGKTGYASLQYLSKARPVSPQPINPAPTPNTNGISYAPYNGVNYANQGLSAARVAALDKAKRMVTIQWTAPCDFPTWASKSGVFNRAVATDKTSNTKFVKGKTYTGIPYSMTDHSYNDVAWANLLKQGISKSSMTKRYSNYPVSGTAKGIDCSYFVYEAIKSAVGSSNITYLTTSHMLNSRYYKKINRSSMKPGDIFLKSGHVMMYVGMSGSRYAVFEADANDSKCSYNTYSSSDLGSYGSYRYVGFGD